MKRIWPLLVLVGCLAMASVAAGQEKAPVPTTELKASLAEVKALFGDKYLAAKKIRAETERRAAYSALIDELLEVAESTTKPADRYALLQVAQQIAVQAEDVERTLAIIDEVELRFQVDALSLKVSASMKIAAGLSGPAEHRNIAPHFLTLQQTAVSASRYDLVRRLTPAIQASARQARDKALLTRAIKQTKDVEEIITHYEDYQRAKETLKTAPDDPGSNLVVGKFLCVFRNDWTNGLSYLALGDDATLKAVAGADLSETVAPTTAEAWVKIAENWEKAAEGVQGRELAAFQRRAVSWYEKAVAALPAGGLIQRRVKQQLEALVSNVEPEDELPKFAKEFAGRYFLTSVGKKSQQTTNSIIEFQEDFQVLQDGAPVAKWEVDGGTRIKVAFTAGDDPPVYLTQRGSSQLISATRTTATDSERWELARLTSKRWEQMSQHVKVFNFDIPETTEVLVFYSNGRLNDPLNGARWQKQGNTITMNRGKDGQTVVTLGSGGKTYVGKTRRPTPFGRVKLTIPVKGRLLEDE